MKIRNYKINGYWLYIEGKHLISWWRDGSDEVNDCYVKVLFKKGLVIPRQFID